MPKKDNYTYHYCFQTYGSPISGVITVPFRVFDYDSYENLKIKLGQAHHCPVKEILSLNLLGFELDYDSVEYDLAAEAIVAGADISAAIQAYRNEGVNFVANRILAAYEHGFLDKPAKEVVDIARMILSAKEEIGTATATDFGTEYSDQVLAEILTVLHSGGGQ